MATTMGPISKRLLDPLLNLYHRGVNRGIAWGDQLYNNFTQFLTGPDNVSTFIGLNWTPHLITNAQSSLKK